MVSLLTHNNSTLYGEIPTLAEKEAETYFIQAARALSFWPYWNWAGIELITQGPEAQSLDELFTSPTP